MALRASRSSSLLRMRVARAWRKRDKILKFEGLERVQAEIAGPGRSVQVIAEHVRSRLARQLCDMHTNAQGVLRGMATKDVVGGKARNGTDTP